MIWVISGAKLPDIRIKAESFDEALEKARLRNKDYCGGYVADGEQGGIADVYIAG